MVASVHGDGDLVFRALADPGRRQLLDALFSQDGQTLHELCEVLPGMTRFGVMKHLRLLAEAGLITTQPDGRSKRHFLNPVPLREIHDRWISKFAEPWVSAMSDLKQQLENETWPEPDTSTRPTSKPPPSRSGER